MLTQATSFDTKSIIKPKMQAKHMVLKKFTLKLSKLMEKS